MPNTPRLRPHPEDRLAAPVQHIDLPATFAALLREPHPPVSGHRQIAVFRRGHVTILAFAFDAGGLLKEHRADGVVTIHALTGHLKVTFDDATHELAAGQLLALAPGIEHSVQAVQASTMLLTVCRGHADDGSGT